MLEQPARLYLVTPRFGSLDGAPDLEAALGAGDVACLLLRLAPMAERDAKQLVKQVAPTIQDRGVALLLEEPRLAARTGADGAHVTDADDGLRAALDSLKPERIVGVGGLGTRDDAMRAGEAGADYLMFGDVDQEGAAATLDRVGWWAEIFNVPCVGVAHRLGEVAALAAAGAEFVALGSAVWDDPRGVAAAVAEAQSHLDRARARDAEAQP